MTNGAKPHDTKPIHQPKEPRQEQAEEKKDESRR